jgi:hypothetical protein
MGGGGSPAPTMCGNGKMDPGEQCDGTLGLAGKDCPTLLGNPNAKGLVSCNKCMVDMSMCTRPLSSGAGGMGGTSGH